MEKRYLLFDLDGTLTESGPGIVNSVEYALKKMGIREHDREKLRLFIGPPLAESLMKYYGMTENEAARGIRIYREYYTEKGMFENSVYEGIPELLLRLRDSGFVSAVATSKPEVYAGQILRHFGLSGYFCGIYGATMDEKRVHKAEVIRYALDTMGLAGPETENARMVGDRENDIRGAHQNGLKAIGVRYGYGSREELEAAGADYLAEQPQDIWKLVSLW